MEKYMIVADRENGLYSDPIIYHTLADAEHALAEFKAWAIKEAIERDPSWATADLRIKEVEVAQ